MDLADIKYKNLLRLCKENNCDTATRLAVFLGATKQHASAILNKKSPIGKVTIERLSKAWGISTDEFIRVDTTRADKTPQNKTSQEIPWELRTIIDGMSKRLDEFAERVEAQGKALQGFQSDCLSVKNDITNIYTMMNEAANTGKIKNLRKAG